MECWAEGKGRVHNTKDDTTYKPEESAVWNERVIQNTHRVDDLADKKSSGHIFTPMR